MAQTNFNPVTILKSFPRLLICTIVVCCIVTAASSALACPNCKQGLLENGQQGHNLARGFELSIYLMLGTPLMILGGLGLLFYTHVRHAHANAEEVEIDVPNTHDDWKPASHGSVAQ